MRRVWYLKLILLLSATALLGGAGALATMGPDNARSILFHQIEWQELTAEQQSILKPLASRWATMKYSERERWRAMAERYKQLPPAEQKRIHGRMQRWAETTSTQRQVARANYRKFREKASPDKKQEAIAAWQNYAATQGLLEYAVDESAAADRGDAAKAALPVAGFEGGGRPDSCPPQEAPAGPRTEASTQCAGPQAAAPLQQAQAPAGNR